jgi:hypothetical protein
MSWLPNGPKFVFAPRDASFHRLSRRNEGGEQGLVARIAIEPGDPTTMYAVVRPTSGNVGLFRSSGAGTSTEDWGSIVDGLQQGNPQIDPSCVAVDPVTPSTIYMASYYDASVYVSTTRGDSWAPGVYLGARIRKLVIDPRTAGSPTATVLYAATDQGVFRSADSGGSWTNVLGGDVWSFSASMPVGGPDAYYAGVLRSGLFSTADPTGMWTNLNTAGIGLPAYNAAAPGGENFNVVYADLCPLNPSRLYVLLLSGTGANFSALYTSGNPSASWSQVAVGAVHPDTGYGFYGFFGVYDFAFAVAPNSPGDGLADILFFGSLGFWRSSDAGRTWTQPPEILHADHHEIAFYPSAPPAGTIPSVYFGCDGGLAASDRFCDPAVDISVPPADSDELNAYTDTGEVQNYDHGISSLATYAYASHASMPALQYTACQDTGVAGGVKTGGWRSLADADATQIAIAPGTDGVKVWFDLGQFGGWANYHVLMTTDQGGYAPGLATVTYPTSGSQVVATSQFNVTPAGACLLGMQTLDAAPASTIRSTVGLIDQSANAVRISQDFSPASVSAVCVASGGGDSSYCASSDNRVWTTPSVSAANAGTVWTEVATGRPATVFVSSLTIDLAGNAYVLASFAVSSGALTTPLFAVTGGSWVAQNCTGVPAGVSLGKILADPVSSSTLYASGGARVYKLTLAAGSWTWQDISDNLPGQPVYDMWIGNVGTVASPKVILRVTIPTRGVWELDVSTAGSAAPITLYLRDNFLDQGLFPTSPDGIPSPYAPADPTQTAVHWACADIKVDAQQQPGGGNPAFFQTDPEGGTIPISPVAFDCLDDASSNLPSTDTARVHVQVHNASLAQAKNVLVWAIYANASGHVPSLGKSASQGNAFPFWSQFGVAGGVATITPNLPSDSPWAAVGPPITLSATDAAHPKVASWNWTVPTLPTGDPGHFCMVAFVHSADNPITETALDVDTITPRNRGIGQRNLHIGPPLPASPGPKGGPMMHEYVEIHNPFAEDSEFDVVFDFRSLPKELQVRLQFTHLDTVEPLHHALVGIASAHAGNLVEIRTNKDSDHGRHCKHSKRIELPSFVDRIHVASPSTRVLVQGVKLQAYEQAGAFLSISNTGNLSPGARYRFTVRQVGIRQAVGGGTYIVRIGGVAHGPTRFVAPSHDYTRFLKTGEMIQESDPKSLPPWIRYYSQRDAN